MEPLAIQNQNVAIHYVQNIFYRKVDYLEAIPPFQAIDLGALAAQTRSARTNVTNLDMPDDEFGQFRWYPMDNAQIRLFLPPAVGKFSLKNLQTTLDINIRDIDPCLHLTEFCVWEDNRPAIEAVNGMDYALNAVRMIAFGFRYHTVDISGDSDLIRGILDGSKPCTHVWASGRSI
jgi:hypothetical protein